MVNIRENISFISTEILEIKVGKVLVKNQSKTNQLTKLTNILTWRTWWPWTTLRTYKINIINIQKVKS